MTTALFAYPAALTRTHEGTVIVAFPDLPEALTEGDDEEDALKQAIDCLDEAIAGRIADREDIPTPTTKGRYVVLVPALTAAKAALYLAMREVGISNVKLGRRLGLDERQVRRPQRLRLVRIVLRQPRPPPAPVRDHILPQRCHISACAMLSRDSPPPKLLRHLPPRLVLSQRRSDMCRRGPPAREQTRHDGRVLKRVRMQ